MAVNYLFNDKKKEEYLDVIDVVKKNIKDFKTINAFFMDGREEHTQYEKFLRLVSSQASSLLSVDLFTIKNGVRSTLYDNPNWFDDLVKGKKTELPTLRSDRTADDTSEKQEVYESLMPLYRALREDYKGRSIFQWIFNHEKYVAVRDSYRAVERLIKNLTGDSQAVLDAEYNDHKNNIKPRTEEETRLRYESLMRNAEEEDKDQERSLHEEEILNNNLSDVKDHENEQVNQIQENMPKDNQSEEDKKKEELRQRMEKQEMERIMRESEEVNLLNSNAKTPEERALALETNSIYRKEIRDFLDEMARMFNTNTEEKNDQFFNKIASVIHYGNNDGEMCREIFDAICAIYVTEEVDAESIKDIQVVSDRIAAKLVFPGDPAKQRAYAGNALLHKKGLEQYFNVSSSVIQAAKIAYREDIGELYQVNANNAMERQARGEYKEGVKFDLDEKKEDDLSEVIYDDEEDSVDFSLDV